MFARSKRFLREVKEISHVQQDRVQKLGSAVFRLHVLVQRDSLRGQIVELTRQLRDFRLINYIINCRTRRELIGYLLRLPL